MAYKTKDTGAEDVFPASHGSDLDSRESIAHENAVDEVAIEYHTLEWWQAGFIMIAETVSLGILSLPAVLAAVGLVPGIILILVFGIMSGYSGLVMGQFREKYPRVQSFGDAGEVLGCAISPGMGLFFREFLGWAQTVFVIFVMGSHLLTWTICLRTLSSAATCSIVWTVVGLVIFWACNLPRTFKQASYTSIVSCLSVLTAVLVTMVDVGIEKPIGTTAIEIARTTSFTTAFLAVTNIGVAFSGHSAFFSILSEFKRPSDWPKALAFLQICDTTMYLVAAVVIYVYVGPDVPSPALSAAKSVTVRKAIWGIAIPTIVIAGVIYGHVASKYIFTRIFPGGDNRHVVTWTKRGTATWVAVTFGVWVIAFIIAESIPVFSDLLSLLCALFASWFSYGLPGVFWLFLNKGEWFATPRKIAAFTANILLMLAGTMLCVLGLWSCIVALETDAKSLVWSCSAS